MVNKPAGGNRKRPSDAEGSEGTKRSVEDIVAKYKYEPPKDDEKTSVFSQHFISKPTKAVIIYQCDSCQELASNFSKDIRCGELPVLCLPLCLNCVSANRKVSQTTFFNLTLKNMTESLQKAKTE